MDVIDRGGHGEPWPDGARPGNPDWSEHAGAAQSAHAVKSEQPSTKGVTHDDVQMLEGPEEAQEDGGADQAPTVQDRSDSPTASANDEKETSHTAHITDGFPERSNDNSAKKQSFDELYGQLQAAGTTLDERSTAYARSLAQELFERVYTTTRVREKPFKAEGGYPTLSDEEADAMFALCQEKERHSAGGAQRWKRAMGDLSRDMHRSKWTLTQLIQKYADQTKVAPTPTQGAWGKPRHPATATTTPHLRPAFSFQEGAFRTEAVAAMTQHCVRNFDYPAKLREPTQLELDIMLGMMEGTVVATHLPQFLRRVCDATTLLRLQNTIIAQVEGELVGQLSDNTPVYRDNQTSERLVDAVMLAARARGGDTTKVYAMLRDIKVAAYNPATHALHFVFFTREAASKWQDVEIPFCTRLIRLKNAHEPPRADEKAADVWKRQLGADGVENADSRARYRVQLYNVSRFVNITQLVEYLKHRLGASFYAYSVDSYGPRSKESLTWELLFDSTVCPSQLDGVYRLHWLGHTIIMHHASRQRQPPCLSCGKPGHFVRHCQTPDAELRVKNCLNVDEKDTAGLATAPRTFKSVEEVKQALQEGRKE